VRSGLMMCAACVMGRMRVRRMKKSNQRSIEDEQRRRRSRRRPRRAYASHGEARDREACSCECCVASLAAHVIQRSERSNANTEVRNVINAMWGLERTEDSAREAERRAQKRKP